MTTETADALLFIKDGVALWVLSDDLSRTDLNAFVTVSAPRMDEDGSVFRLAQQPFLDALWEPTW